MDQYPFIVPVWVADILRNENVTVLTVRDLRPEDLITGEIGTLDCGFVFIESPPAAFDVEASIPKPKQITHGPQRKGRGGKIRRW